VRRALAVTLCLGLAAAPLAAQGAGTVVGRVVDAATRAPLDEAEVILPGLQRKAITDSAGVFRIREVPPGWVRLTVLRFGYRPAARESLLVRSGETAELELSLVRARETVDTLPAIDVATTPDVVLDPLLTADVQRFSGEELRRLPVTTVDEAVALSAGAVAQSYRGGRLGEEAFILDGLPVKNQLDASTGGLGVRVPPDLLTEAALVTNGFSARYGQALSGLVNVVTRDGGEHWNGRLAYETDRPLPERWDYGQDRLVAAADGPLAGPLRLALAADVRGSLDADPVNAPPPSDTLDPRRQRPNLLPHNSGEQYDLAAKITAALGGGHTLRLFGLGSLDQRLLYDPALKYDLRWAPAQRVSGSLLSAHWQYATPSRAARSFVGDLRVAYFTRDVLRGPLQAEPSYRFGAFTGQRFRVLGEDLARSQDTAAARAPIPGYATPQPASGSPWGVPAFFLADGGRGDLAWNHFTELRARLDVNFGGRAVDLYGGGELARQHVQTFQRVLAYLPVGDSVPASTVADFTPLLSAAYAETQVHLADVAVTAGLRYDRFEPRTGIGGRQTRARAGLSPRFAFSTVLRGATIVASYGRFHEAPDFQYLVDAAFDDSTRTGRFRVGNPDLGFESATQYELSLRARPEAGLAVRVNAYYKQLEGLVASVPFGLDPDSTIFGNADRGSVKGLEVLLEREFGPGVRARILYTLQSAQATASNAFELFRRIRTAPGRSDTITPGTVEFPLDYDRRHALTVIALARMSEGAGPRLGGVAPIGGLEASGVFRYASGLPYSRTDATGDTLIGVPNQWRLPAQWQLDALLRRPVRVGGVRAAVYVQARNLTNRRNLVAVRRDTGAPALGTAGIDSAAAAAMRAHPEPIPAESPRYRAWADANGDGFVAGAELLPLYRAAARDFFQPLFAYGAPRLVRLGVEVIF
jgi:hypothetical protein